MTEAIRTDRARIIERLGQPPLNVFLVNMEGELNLSLHEPIGLEAVAGRLLSDVPGVGLRMHDTQSELVRHGKIQTDELVRKIHELSDTADCPLLIGIGVPINSWDYTKALLIKLQQNPINVPTTIVLGNAIPTFTEAELIKRDFPEVTLVAGEGEEIFSAIAKKIIAGEPVRDQLKAISPDLNQYVLPHRVFTQEVIDLGGSVKVETSRGCPHGNCTFCSRCERGGKDYRVIPEGKVVRQFQQLLAEFDIDHFELTDEEAFGDLEATKRLISAIKSANLPRIPFVASLRTNTLVDLEQDGLLDQLMEIGLQKVFVGAEGGSNAYLRQMGKKQTVAEIEETIRIAKERGLNFELGFITFSWRMTFDMLRENAEFLSTGDYTEHVSALFNLLAVRAGTHEEKILKKYAREGEKIRDYIPDDHFNINSSVYADVPFIDPKVAEAFNFVKGFEHESERVYYALKSLVRAGALPESHKRELTDCLNALKRLDLRMLREAVGLDPKTDLRAERDEVMVLISNLIGFKSTGDAMDILRREVKVFLSEEDERQHMKIDQVGSLIVLTDPKSRILLIRARGDGDWGFPGGNVKPGEDEKVAGLRETFEEVCLDSLTIEADLPTIVKQGHEDVTTGFRKSLTLYHHLVRLDSSVSPNIIEADHEIVDYLWLSPEEIIGGKVSVKQNVLAITEFLQNQSA